MGSTASDGLSIHTGGLASRTDYGMFTSAYGRRTRGRRKKNKTASIKRS